jgi:hypothetical protein
MFASKAGWTRKKPRAHYVGVHAMTSQEFLYVYVSCAIIISVLIFIIRFNQLKPLINAKQAEALIINNYHNQSMLSQIGIRVNSVGPVIHIEPPSYTPDELLKPNSLLTIWVSQELPTEVLTSSPRVSVLVLKSLTPSLIVLFMLLMPAVFIIKGMYA